MAKKVRTRLGKAGIDKIPKSSQNHPFVPSHGTGLAGLKFLKPNLKKVR